MTLIPMMFCVVLDTAAQRNEGLSYLNHSDENKKVVVLEINRMVRTNGVCNRLDDDVPVEIFVSAD